MFSLIVPVYNVENYVERCVKSIIDQNYKMIEIILVDDGSTDKSGVICDNYSANYSFIRTFHKKNGGLSDARNYGVKQAKGDYIFFIDSDDFISQNSCFYINELLNKYNDIDVVAGTLTKHFNGRSIEQKFEDYKELTNGKEFILSQLKHNSLHVSACRYFYKKDFLLKHGFEFQRNLLHEDEHWTIRVLLKTNRIIVTGFVIYHHMIRQGSITQQKDKTKNANDLIFICKDLAVSIDLIDEDELRILLLNYLASLYYFALYIGKFKNTMDFIDRDFLTKCSVSFENRVKLEILLFNKYLFYLFTYIRMTFVNRTSIGKIIEVFKNGKINFRI